METRTGGHRVTSLSRRAAIVLGAAALVAAVLLPPPLVAPTANAASRGVEKGISFTGYSAASYSGANHEQALREVKATGADWVMILVTQYQPTTGSTAIAPDATLTPTDASLESIIAYAHSIGLKVMLKPHVNVSDGTPRALIGQTFTSDQWTSWFASYDAMLLHYAELAAATRCEQFCVGCELDATVSQVSAWRHTIADVRRVYSGRLTYSADSIFTGAQVCTWWGALDFIGFSAYPKLVTTPEPTVAELLAGWKTYYAKVAAVHARYGKPVIFTEIGCPSVAGAALAPADWHAGGAVDLAGQQRWYEAALKAFAGQRWMKGMFWWNWSTYPGVGGPNDTGYTPDLKPAGTTLTSWYTTKLR